jgi:hypothetical protein
LDKPDRVGHDIVKRSVTGLRRMYINDQYLGAAFTLVVGFMAFHFFTSDERPNGTETQFDVT